MSISLNIVLLLFGLAIGSFINMAAYRIPAELSILRPRSYCNHCKTTLPFFALIPVVGYIFTKGKCFKCKIKIPLEYPIVELLCGAFFVFISQYYNASFELISNSTDFFTSQIFVQILTALWLFSTGLLLSIIDFKHHILPDIIVIPGVFINIILSTCNQYIGFSEALIGAFAGGVGLFLISKLYELIRKKEGMGFGDVKYLAFLGAALGWQGVIFTIFLASVLGSVIGIFTLLVQKKNLHTPIPFGPFLAVSGLIYFLKLNILW